MTDRATTTLTVQGHSFVVKTYATAREANTIQQALFKGTKIGIVGDQPQINEFNPGAQFDMECELVKQMVLEMDGNTDYLTVLEAQPAGLWNELVRELDALVAKKKS